MLSKRTLFLAQAAMIAAIYVALTRVFAPISYREVQVRIAEALTILPVFTLSAASSVISSSAVQCRMWFLEALPH